MQKLKFQKRIPNDVTDERIDNSNFVLKDVIDETVSNSKFVLKDVTDEAVEHSKDVLKCAKQVRAARRAQKEPVMVPGGETFSPLSMPTSVLPFSPLMSLRSARFSPCT